MEAVDNFLYFLEKFLYPTTSLQESIINRFPGIVPVSAVIVIIVSIVFFGAAQVKSSKRFGWLFALVFIVIPWTLVSFTSSGTKFAVNFMLVGLLISKLVVCLGGLGTGQWSVRNFPIFLFILVLAFVVAEPIRVANLLWLPLLAVVVFNTVQVGLIWHKRYREDSSKLNMLAIVWLVVVVFWGLLLEPEVIRNTGSQPVSLYNAEYGYLDLAPIILWLEVLLVKLLDPLFPVMFSLGFVYGMVKLVSWHKEFE